jgi:parallel beta-helix repeat protein
MILGGKGKQILKIVTGLAEITVLTILIAGTVGSVDRGIENIRIHDPLQISGKLESEGTHFVLNNSDDLNINLESSEPIELVLEAIPEMLTIHISSSSGAATTMITMGGFLPLTTYHKYEDDYHDHVPFTTDENGSFTYTQDISASHLIFIQPMANTYFINDNVTGGDCYKIGIWKAATRTCTLTTDLTETIQIDSDSIILDGGGHLINGTRKGNGVYLSGRQNVNINNLASWNFYVGIVLYNSSYNTLTSNDASNNYYNGITLINSSNNNLTGNIAKLNIRDGIGLDYFQQ